MPSHIITQNNVILYWVVYSLILLGGLGIGIGVLFGLRHHDQGRKLRENGILVFLSIFLTLMVVELFFRLYAETDGRIYTLASQNWFGRYWLYNSRGYRDVEWREADLQQKRRVVVVGDSFAAGMGIEKLEDRFSNILNDRLGTDYIVLNIAEVAINTREEIERVKAFPYKPKILIWQYYINDLEDIAKDRGVRFTVPKTQPWPILNPIVKISYAFNFLWWRSVAMGPRSWEKDYLTWVQEVYDDSAIWWLHQQDLQRICDGVESENIQLIVVVFPSMTNVKRSHPITSKVIDFYRQRGIQVLDVGELVKDVPSTQLVISSFDAHPNEWVHHLVADALYQIVQKLHSVD